MLARPLPRSSLSAQRIYFVMTDRFANADPGNDRGGRTGAAGVTGFDPRDTGFFHGGDLSGLRARLGYVKRLGMSAIWVTPPVTQRTVQGTSAGYHGYWGTDFTNVDPHLGTNDDFRRLVERAHALGLKVFLDVVVNHTGDVVAYREPVARAPRTSSSPRSRTVTPTASPSTPRSPRARTRSPTCTRTSGASRTGPWSSRPTRT